MSKRPPEMHGFGCIHTYSRITRARVCGYPYVRAFRIDLKPGRHNGNKSPGHAPDYKGSVHDFGISVEMFLPQSLVHRKIGRVVRFSSFRNDFSFKERAYTERFKGI